MNIKWTYHLYSYSRENCYPWNQFSITESHHIFCVNYSERLPAPEGESLFRLQTWELSADTGAELSHSQIESPSAPPSPAPAPFTAPDTLHYVFGDNDVYMDGEWTLCCKDKRTGETRWKRNLRHWLYTKIQCRNGVLYLGTQGNGGIFYALSLGTGDILFSMPISEPEFYWIQNNLLVCDKKQTWNLLDPISGAVLDRSPAAGKVVYQIQDNIYLLTEKYNRSARQYDAALCCITL